MKFLKVIQPLNYSPTKVSRELHINIDKIESIISIGSEDGWFEITTNVSTYIFRKTYECNTIEVFTNLLSSLEVL